MDQHALHNGRIGATITAAGAELCSLRDAAGTEWLWQAGPAWPRHAPVLFPIVGRLKDDALHHQGRTYRLTQHGFARDRRFAWSERHPTACRLVLEDDAESRAVYPFAFRLEFGFALEDDTLVVSARLANPGAAVLPASLGAHPAFRWPLREGIAKSDHLLRFAAAETAPVRRLTGGLLQPGTHPNPIRDGVLALDEALFAADALILDQPASRSLRYEAPCGRALEISWTGYRELGLWMKPGAAFLCIEPWYGMASPADFDGAFLDKPGLMLIPPGERRVFEYRVRVIPGA